MVKKALMYLFKRRVILALFIIIQFVIFGFVINQSLAYSILWETLFTVLSIGVAFHVVWKKGKEAYKITWILQVLIFPVYGTLFYLMFNRQTHTRKLQNKLEQIYDLHLPHSLYEEKSLISAEQRYPLHGRLMHYLSQTAGFPLYNQTETEYYPVGEAYYEALKQAISRAEKYIFFEFFIIADGTMWQSLLDLMIEKAEAGVDVRIMYDDIGSFVTLPSDIKQKIESKGISCRIYNPFHPVLTSSQNNRDHRKIVSVDGHTAFTGGINIGDEYINEIERFGHWKDNGVRLTGKGAWGLTLIFLQLWQTMDDDLTDAEIPDLKPVFASETAVKMNQTGFVQPFSDSPTDKKNYGEHVFIKLIHAAQKSVVIYTPYLILDENLETALILAAESGVEVTIITPKKWDKYLVHVTTRSYYAELIESGIKIYEYTPGFMHAKTVLIDDEVALVGTINLDYRSLYLHFENAVILYGGSVMDKIRVDINETLKVSEQIHLNTISQSKGIRIMKSVLRLFAPLM
ncbi:cardiolipin synthase [Alkalibacterium olivapovliticus]|uniref:Cardiolipin synthase n=1 Tax=Alkalibacterium olivapovliticus TaxID=99907 RepID=A0A2T0W809_9LACT|nr:cardiolipin synthase [Alkalibacterium olivapovliticus]PRY82809.1 cardiolipin synthase [Alkalibacterium olivapovliticus]